MADTKIASAPAEADYSKWLFYREAENINLSYVSQLLRMALLAPEIVESFLRGNSQRG